MFCLETIIALNDKAAEKARKGEPLRNAFSEVGVNLSKKEVVKEIVKEVVKEEESNH